MTEHCTAVKMTLNNISIYCPGVKITVDYEIKLITKSCVWNDLFSMKKVCMWAISAWKISAILHSKIWIPLARVCLVTVYSFTQLTFIQYLLSPASTWVWIIVFVKSISKSSLKQEKGALHSYMSLNSQINPVRKKKIVHVCLCVCVRAQKTSLEREYLAWAHTLRGDVGTFEQGPGSSKTQRVPTVPVHTKEH